MLTPDGHVVTCPGIIVWDGLTKPETKEGQKTKWSLKIAMAPTAPEIVELQALAQKTLNEDPTFKGTLPNGGCWPILEVDPEKTDPSLAGCLAINAKTTLGLPTIVDKNSQPINPVHLNNLIYPGAKVRLIVNAYAFDNISKGIAFNLDGVQIVDSNLPKLAIAAGIDAAAAFGAAPLPAGAGPPAMTPAPPATGPTTAPPATGPTTAPPPPSAPANDFAAGPGATPRPLGAPGHEMTATAVDTYDGYIKAGWNDRQLVDHLLMELVDIPF